MTWNHRVIRQVTDGEESFVVAEVFYEDDGSLIGWAGMGSPFGDTVDELRLTIQWAFDALDKPVLDATDFDMRAIG